MFEGNIADQPRFERALVWIAKVDEQPFYNGFRGFVSWR
jgi:hypothetical protein